MRRLASLAVLPLVLAALTAVAAAPAQASCVASVSWGARMYVIAPGTIAVPPAARARALHGTIPPCRDAVAVDAAGQPLPMPEEPAQPVRLRRGRSIDPRIGVLYGGALYVTVACSDQLAETVPAPTRLPARCGR
jgi:hypothetical protein